MCFQQVSAFIRVLLELLFTKKNVPIDFLYDEINVDSLFLRNILDVCTIVKNKKELFD